jgi:osmotically-inducible protein OsmY
VQHDGAKRGGPGQLAGDGSTARDDPETVGSDAWIRRYLDQHIVHNARERSVLDVLVEVEDGHVKLLGTVPHRVMKQSIEELAAATPGVVAVDNRLRVALTGPWPEVSSN